MTQTAKNVDRKKSYDTGVRSNSGEIGMKAGFSIGESDAHEIIRLSDFLAKNGLYKIEKFDHRIDWLNDDGQDEPTKVRSDINRLNITKDEFWFVGFLRDTRVEVYSARQRIGELKEWLGLRDIDKQTVANAPRVLVVVSGGVADSVCDEGVEVEVFDWDNFNDDPKGTGGVREHFADLAQPLGIPVGEVQRESPRE